MGLMDQLGGLPGMNEGPNMQGSSLDLSSLLGGITPPGLPAAQMPEAGNPFMGDLLSAQDNVRKTQKEGAKLSDMILEGMKVNDQDMNEKTPGPARMALANFFKAIQEGPRFRPIQDEIRERKMEKYKADTARLQAAIADKRAENASAQAQANQARLMLMMDQQEKARQAKLSFEQQVEQRRAEGQKARDAISQSWLELGNRKADQAEKQALFRQGIESHGNLYAWAADLAKREALAQGKELTPEAEHAKYLELYKEQQQFKKTGGSGGMGGNATSELSPEAVDAAAKMYVQTGQMPALGMGSGNLRVTILNRAGQMAKESGDIATNKALFTADMTALRDLTKMGTAVEAFEKTATKNLDLFIDSAKKIQDTNSPLMNMPLREFERRVQGDPNLAAYDTARRIAINEIAKVTTNPNLSGILTNEAREEFDRILKGEATYKQLISAAEMLKKDMGNRIGAIGEQRNIITKRLQSQLRTGAATASPAGETATPGAAPKATKRFNPKTSRLEDIK